MSPEIAVATDGDSIGIYNVRSTHNFQTDLETDIFDRSNRRTR
jgi:hypothetical protein